MGFLQPAGKDGGGIRAPESLKQEGSAGAACSSDRFGHFFPELF